MCGYLLPLGTPRRLRLLHLPPPPPPKSAEIQRRGPSSDCALAHRQTSCPVFTASFAEAREHRHSFLYLSLPLYRFSSVLLSSLARYQQGVRAPRLPPGSRVSRDKRRRIGASAMAWMINPKDDRSRRGALKSLGKIEISGSVVALCFTVSAPSV